MGDKIYLGKTDALKSIAAMAWTHSSQPPYPGHEESLREGTVTAADALFPGAQVRLGQH